MDIDELDRKVLNALIEDSRQSYRQIAKKLKVSVVTAMNRIKILEKNGLIKRYTTLVNYEKLGYGFLVIINARISKGKEFEVEKKLSMEENIYAVYDVTGEFDIEIIGKFRNRQSLDGFVKRLQTIEYVERTNTKLILNVFKEEPIRVS